MESIGILTDSHSGISQEETERLGIRVLPMPFYVDGRCCYENVSLTRDEFFERMAAGAEISTSQPSPADVMKLWDAALAEYEKVLYIPISSGISGSYATAFALAEDAPYEGRVLVVDSGRVATPLHRMVLDALELRDEGYPAEKIREILEENRDKMTIFVGVQTLENLKKGGRISPAAAALGTILNIKPVLQFDVGTLDVYKKCRGFLKAKKSMLEAMKYEIENRFREWYEKGELFLMAASSASEEETKEWVREIQEEFPGMDVMCDYLTLGISCHIGQGGLGIACACRPSRP